MGEQVHLGPTIPVKHDRCDLRNKLTNGHVYFPKGWFTPLRMAQQLVFPLACRGPCVESWSRRQTALHMFETTNRLPRVLRLDAVRINVQADAHFYLSWNKSNQLSTCSWHRRNRRFCEHRTSFFTVLMYIYIYPGCQRLFLGMFFAKDCFWGPKTKDCFYKPI
jgi:hypothetical protein